MVGGSLLFLVCVILMPFAPTFALACALLVIGGIGSAAFANMQTSLIVLHAPPHIRSRLMGLLTVCIGMGPLGDTADRLAGRPLRAAAGGGHHGARRPGRGQRDRTGVAAE